MNDMVVFGVKIGQPPIGKHNPSLDSKVAESVPYIVHRPVKLFFFLDFLPKKLCQIEIYEIYYARLMHY